MRVSSCAVSASAISSVSRSIWGRNSWRGGSSRRMITGKPSMASRIFSKSSRCMGSSFSRAGVRSSSEAAMTISCMRGRRSGALNIRSVRHKPMPSAPKVRDNADTPANAHKARTFSAEGIGLCRPERMFNDPERLPLMQEMVIAASLEERTPALEKLLPMQRDDFEKILEAMDGFPVIIRLLDPPLHEFLPQIDRLTEEMAEAETAHDEARIAYLQKVIKRYNELKEFNPMIGFRGCRVGIVYPDIYQLQVRAIAEATATLVKRGLHPMPEIMLPLVGHVNEIKVLKPLVQEELDKVFEREGITVAVKIGTMVEVPRACLTADEIAEYAEFFSFGTNDLTQTTFAYSRDDAAGTFLPTYLDAKILNVDPFQSIDQKGVGKLVRIAVVLGRQTNPKIEIGICGEHGGDPDSIEFCHLSGLDYVSCSAPRVPIARLAAAQAVIKNRPATS